MQLIKCEIALDLVWCENYIILEKMGNMLQVLMSVLILTFFELLCTQTVLRWHILTVLESNTFQKKSKHSQAAKHYDKCIYRIQAYISVMCDYFCIRFIGFMLKDELLTTLITYFYSTILPIMINNLKIYKKWVTYLLYIQI